MKQSEKLAIIGYAMYYKGYSKEELDDINEIEAFVLFEDYRSYIKTLGDESK